MSFSSKVNSFFWAGVKEQAIPILIWLVRMHVFTQEILDFHQRHILLNKDIDRKVSIHRPCLVIKARVRPLLMFWTQMVLTVASSFLLPHRLTIQSLFFFYLRNLNSTLIWLKSVCWATLRLLTMMVVHFKVMATFSVMSTVWLLRMIFILIVDGAKREHPLLSHSCNPLKTVLIEQTNKKTLVFIQ